MPACDLPKLDGYVGFFAIKETAMGSRSRKGEGGVVIYVKENYSKYASLWKSSENGTKVWVKLDKHVGFDQDLFIAGCYFPHESSAFLKHPSFFGLHEDLIQDVAQVKAMGLPIIGGDFNARTGSLDDSRRDFSKSNDLLNWAGVVVEHSYHNDQIPTRANQDSKENKLGRALIELCLDCRVSILNGRTKGDEKGNLTCREKSCIDYFLAPFHDLAGKLDSLIVLDKDVYGKSDHRRVQLTLLKKACVDVNSKSYSNHLKEKSQGRYNLNSDEKIAIYQRALKNHPEIVQKLELAMADETNLNDAARALRDAIFSALQQVYPGESCSGKKNFCSNRWFDADCKEKKKAFHKALKTPGTHAFRERLQDYKATIRRKKRWFNKYRAAYLVDLAKNNPSKFWRIFKGKKVKKVMGNCDPKVWEEYFASLLNALAVFDKVDTSSVQSRIHQGDGTLSKPIEEQDIAVAAGTLQRNKMADLDGMIAEYLINAIDLLKAPIAKLFQKVFTSGSYPDDWCTGIICPIFKKGDPNDCSNFRGITAGSILGKLYATVLEGRLDQWVEKEGLRADFQAGFRKDYRTMDNVFILKTLIAKAKALNSIPKKKRLYVCFVDFKKAFDTVPRSLLWERLSQLGVNGQFLQAVKCMYDKVICRVKTPSGFTNPFPSTLGVKQGCPLSPLLFGLYIDHIQQYLNGFIRYIDAPRLNTTPIPALLYADDLALISESKCGLQTSLEVLEYFCSTKGLSVNLEKTKILVFNDNRSLSRIAEEDKFMLDGKNVEVTDTYTYLGIIFDSRKGDWKAAKENTKEAAKRAYFAAMNRMVALRIPCPILKCSLFDSLVSSVMSYGSDMWGVDYLRESTEFHELEVLHKNFLKRILHLRNSTPNEVVMIELGRLPLKFQWFKLIIRYFNRMVTMTNENRLLKLAFNVDLELPNSWSNKVKAWVVETLELQPDITWPMLISESSMMSKLQHKYFQWLQSDSRTKFKIHSSLFRRITGENCSGQSGVNCIDFGQGQCFDISPASYLTQVPSEAARYTLAKFRTHGHTLESETGIWQRPQVPREQRLCQCCDLGCVEDEMHFVFDCPVYCNIRGQFHERLFEGNVGCMRQLFAPQNVNAMGQFLKQCFQLRDTILADKN